MAKGKKSEEGVKEEQPAEGATQIEPQPETMYSQSQVNAYLKEVQEEAKVEAWEKYQGIQRTLTEKDRKIKEYEANLQKPTQPNVLSSLTKITEELERQASQSDDPTAPTRIAQLKAEIRKEEERVAYEAQVKQWQSSAAMERMNLEQRIKEAGFDPNDDMFADVFESWELSAILDQRYDRAERKLDRIIKKAPKPEKKEVETEAQVRERLTREIYEKEGLTGREKATPSAGTPTLAGISREKIAELSQTVDGQKWLVTHSDELLKLAEQGKI